MQESVRQQLDVQGTREGGTRDENDWMYSVHV